MLSLPRFVSFYTHLSFIWWIGCSKGRGTRSGCVKLHFFSKVLQEDGIWSAQLICPIKCPKERFFLYLIDTLPIYLQFIRFAITPLRKSHLLKPIPLYTGYINLNDHLNCSWSSLRGSTGSKMKPNCNNIGYVRNPIWNLPVYNVLPGYHCSSGLCYYCPNPDNLSCISYLSINHAKEDKCNILFLKPITRINTPFQISAPKNISIDDKVTSAFYEILSFPTFFFTTRHGAWYNIQWALRVPIHLSLSLSLNI